jgi:calcium-translocating P-type ATPase
MPTAIHRLTVAEALDSLRSAPRGLTTADAAMRRREFGENRLIRARQRSAFRDLVAQLTHFFAIVLWVAAALALLAEYRSPGSGMSTLAAAVGAVIVINGFFSFWQERRAHQAIAALQRLLPESVRVRRDGRLVDTSSTELVPGDIIELAEGDHIPADCRLIEAFDVTIDNATLTGESLPQVRTADVDEAANRDPAHYRNIVLAGTAMTSGNAVALVLATGMRTEFGRIAHLTQTAPDIAAPLQLELVRLSRIVATLSVLLGIALFAIGRLVGLPLWANFVFAIGVIVANVPEGLLPTLTLSLAMAAQRMAARKTLVRHLPAVQTLGSATVICTDKTGTLTQNRMAARRVFVRDDFHEVNDLSRGDRVSRDAWQLFEAAALCETARVDSAGGRPGLHGDPMEIALIELAERVSDGVRALPRLDLLPFSPERRRMATLHDDGAERLLYVKGALEAVLPRCVARQTAAGDATLTDAGRQRIQDAEGAMASSGLRVLAFAYRHVARDTDREHLEESLTFAGLIGLHDPPRPEVPRAIAQCRGAGIKVIMVTGDHAQTALAIARAIGLGSAQLRVITGHDLEHLSDAQLRFTLEHPELVFARVSAEQKLRIVRALQQAGAIVAVTGDGVNDAPALKAADIGVAMGQSGTDVAREAADVILLDDNFASIVAAIEEGRGVFDSVRKFITYVLTSNVPELVPYLAFVLLRIPLPLTIIQVLAVDLGTDMLPGLGLGTERPEAYVMTAPPRARSERIIDRGLLVRAYVVLGFVEAAAGMAAYAFVLARGGWHWDVPLDASSLLYRQATTACLTAIVLTQVANVFACRSETEPIRFSRLLSNHVITAGVIVELAIIIAIDYTPLGHAIFGTAAISWECWLVGAMFMPLLVAVDTFFKRGSGTAASRFRKRIFRRVPIG